MSKTEIRERIRNVIYSKDYDTKLNKNAYVLADEIMVEILPLLETKDEPVVNTEQWVTISGVKYKLEEIK